MKELLHLGVSIIAQIHNAIMHLNDAYEANFTDKELHFLIIGLLGMAMIFVIYPLFKYLAQHGHEMVIAWFYVFTVIFVITFAIEIGQEATNTGNMDFGDIAYGIAGCRQPLCGRQYPVCSYQPSAGKGRRQSY